MDYFNINGKLKSMQKKLASAAKYLPKDLIKHVPESMGGKKKGDAEIEQADSDDAG